MIFLIDFGFPIDFSVPSDYTMHRGPASECNTPLALLSMDLYLICGDFILLPEEESVKGFLHRPREGA